VIWTVACSVLLLVASAPPSGAPPHAPESYPSEEALRRYGQARLLEERGAADDALAEYSRHVVTDPRSVSGLLRLSELAARAGRISTSLDFARRALAVDSSSARGWWLQGSAEFNLGLADQALGSLQRAVARDSGEADFLRTLARVAERLDRFDLVAKAYRRAVELEWDDGESWFQLAAAEARMGRFADARHALNEALEHNPIRPGVFFLQGWVAEGLGRRDEAIGHYREHLALHEDDQVTRRRLIHLHAQRGEWPEALVEARQLAARAPGDAESLEELAELAFRAGRPDEGERTLEKLEALQPDELPALARRIELLARNERHEQAVARAKAWEREHPGDYHGPLLAARALAIGGDAEGGAREARRALGLAPDSLAPRLLLGRIYQNARRWTDAAAVWEEATGRWPDLVPLYLDLATCRLELKDSAGAEKAVRDILSRVPNHPSALNFLGYLLADENRGLAEAESLVRRAVEMDPDNGAFVDSMGWVHFRLGRLAEARRELERAVDLTGGDAIVREHLGDVYLALELRDLAREQYRKSLEGDPANIRVRSKLDALR
jgi:tetratricopeptide (TPR) repeat protein